MKHEKLEGSAKMLRIFIDEADYWENDLLYEAIVKKAHMLEIAGATVFRGLMATVRPLGCTIQAGSAPLPTFQSWSR